MKFCKMTIDFGGLLGYIVESKHSYAGREHCFEGWLESQEDVIYVHHNLAELIEEMEQTAWVVLNQDSFTE